jgi:hypothetical protein
MGAGDVAIVSRILQTRPRASRSGPVKITKPDGSIEYEEALSPGAMGRLASAEAAGDRKEARKIVGGARRLSELGSRLDAAARRS